MKRKTGWYAVLATCVMSLLVGCSDQECVESPTALSKVVLTGSAETKDVSRSALSDKGVFSWLEGDQIEVYASDDEFHTFTLTSGAGTGVGFFSGELLEGTQVKEYAVSPAGLTPSLNADGQLSLTLPDAYSWDGRQQTHAPMLAGIEENSLFFKNLGGVMKLSVGNIKQGCRIEVSSATNQLAGTMLVTQDEEGNAILKSVEADSDKQITYTSVSNNEKQSFYLPLPVTQGNVKLNVKVYDAAENGVMKLEKNATLTIHRKELLLMPTLTIPETENAVVKDAATTEDLNSALENAVNAGAVESTQPAEVIVTVNSNMTRPEGEEPSATVEVSAPITIPTALTAPVETTPGEGEGSGTPGEGGGEGTPGDSEGTEPQQETPVVKIIFDEVPQATAATENKIILTDNQKVEDLEPTERESKSQVNVAIPEAPEGVEPPSFEISLPTTTVTLAATQETATFKEVWATTADNTLNVAKGVTIKNLHVISGNVEVSGHIENITNHSDKLIRVRVSGMGSVGNVTGNVSIIYAGNNVFVPFDNEDVADGQNIPYEIATLDQLCSLANRVESGMENGDKRLYADCYYVLTADIDLGKDMLWKPIGTENRSFAGIFDGDGHVIKGNMNLGECDHAGLFGRIDNGGEVRNLTIAANVQIIREGVSTADVVGAFAGYADRATFYNCHYTGNLTIETGYIGGMIGRATNATIKLCSNRGNLTNLNVDGTIGGMIGMDHSSTLTGCYSTGNLTLHKYYGICGGMVGQNNYSEFTTIKACWTSGTYLAYSSGGMAGHGWYHFYYSYWSQSNDWVYSSGSSSTKETDSFEGTTPTVDQISKMNSQISNLGWKYQDDGTLVPMEGNSLPSNTIKPW